MDLTEYRFTKTHEWVHIREGLAYIGITDHAQEEITDLVSVDLPAVGLEVEAGDELLMVDSVKASFSIYAPVSGVVAAVNESLLDDPGLVNTSPYADGWMVALDGASLSGSQQLMDEAAYEEFIAEEE